MSGAGCWGWAQHSAAAAPAANEKGHSGPPCLQVVGLVEELCNRTSLHSFSWDIQRQPLLRPQWPVRHIAYEFAALMEQVGMHARGGAGKLRGQAEEAAPANG